MQDFKIIRSVFNSQSALSFAMSEKKQGGLAYVFLYLLLPIAEMLCLK
jgi:hypothetical protein